MYRYKTSGVCSSQIDFDIVDHKITHVIWRICPREWWRDDLSRVRCGAEPDQQEQAKQ
ncbi:MAG: TSCPD domain-containing protein [Hydrogeniiclostridium mannosilyticum]